MAQIVGGICTSHIPAIGNAIARGLEDDPYWRPFFAGYPRAREWLAEVKPDVAVMVYNDHGLNFFLDKMPTFAIGAAAEYRNADEGWGLPTLRTVPGRPEALVAHHRVGDGGRVRRHDVPGDARRSRVHRAAAAALARTRPARRAHRARGAQHDPASAALAHALLQARPCARPRDRVVSRGCARRAIGTGGMSHQLDGERAGFINKEFDLHCLEKLVDEPEELARYTIHDLVRLAGTQGVELISWLVMRGALDEPVKKVHSHYHIPVSNTAAGLMVLANAA